MTLLNLFLDGVLRSIDTIPVRFAARMLGVVVLFCVLLGATTRGADAPPPPPPADHAEEVHAPVDHAEKNPASVPEAPVAAEAASESHASVAEDIHVAPGDESHAQQAMASDPGVEIRIVELTAVGERFWQRGERESAERTFADALSLNAPVAAKRELLLRMVELYHQAQDPIRAIAVLEKYLQGATADREHAELVMQLGLLYREAGAYSSATARFYQVLRETMRVANDDLDARRRLATKARLEIADTYLTQGNLEEARKFYSRLQLLDLDPKDLERVQFRGAQLQHALKLWEPAERELALFLQAFPESEFEPEARYLRAKALKELDRKDEAVKEVVSLLRGQDSTNAAQARTLAYWKRRTGNELANTFYEQGDFLGALSIYQALAGANTDPSWQWPAVYQVGLCFERLRLPQRAAEAYRVILGPGTAPTSGAPLTDTLASLQGMAKWRLDHLDWVEHFENKLQVLTAGKPVDA